MQALDKVYLTPTVAMLQTQPLVCTAACVCIYIMSISVYLYLYNITRIILFYTVVTAAACTQKVVRHLHK